MSAAAFVLLFSLLFSGSAMAFGPLTLSAAHSEPRVRADGSGFEDRIVKEAFRRIGIPVQLKVLPWERALADANGGIDDGSYVRISGLENTYPNLVMVPEKVSEFYFTAFTKDNDIRIKRWQDLKDYRIGIIIGWKIVEQNTENVQFLTKAVEVTQLFTLLDKGRVQVVVADLYAGLECLRQMGISGVIPLEPPLARRDMFIYLHKKHADLVPRLAETLREMRQDGAIDRLTREGLGDLEAWKSP